MESDLSAFLNLNDGDRPRARPLASVPPLPPRVVSTPRPVLSTNGHQPQSIADIYLSDSEKSSPDATVTGGTLTGGAELGDDGVVSAVFPPAPTRRPRRYTAHDAQMPSLGILDALMSDDLVHDILVNGTQPIYIDIAGQIEDSGLRFNTHEEVWKVAESIMDTIGQRWNADRPMIDTRLPDGSRVNIVAPPMAVDGVTISIRKFPAIHITLERMVARKQMSGEMAEFLSRVVGSRVNLIISGGTSSGKTTLLNALSGSIAPTERIVTIEDSAELRLQQPHVVRLESKSPTSSDNPESAVTIRDLVKNALRMRPDRIIVGESRGLEAFDVIQAMNTGHDGSMTTLHANSPRDALSKLETLVSMAIPQFPMRIVRQQIASTVNLLIQMSRTKEGYRRITHVSELSGMEGETLILQDLIVFQEATANQPEGYRWVGGAARNTNVTDAARKSGMLRPAR